MTCIVHIYPCNPDVVCLLPRRDRSWISCLPSSKGTPFKVFGLCLLLDEGGAEQLVARTGKLPLLCPEPGREPLWVPERLVRKATPPPQDTPLPPTDDISPEATEVTTPSQNNELQPINDT